jgi:hypothetical protein
MIHLLWKVHQDSRQFFDGCEKWDDGEALPRSTFQSTARALVDDVNIMTTLTCPVVEFLGPEPSALGPRQREKREARGVAALGISRPRMHPYPPSASHVKEYNRLYPLMDIMMFARRSGFKYQNLAVGDKGDCTNFGLLGWCPDKNCTFKHLVLTVLEARQRTVKVAMDQGMATLASKPVS